jgi:hypothetical protein
MGKPAPTRVTFTTADIYPHTSAALGLWTEQYSLAICLSGSFSHLQFVSDLREKREEADPSQAQSTRQRPRKLTQKSHEAT